MTTMKSHYPNDADGDVLRRLERSNSDMNAPMAIDFYSYVNSEKEAGYISDVARDIGYETRVDYDGELSEWSVKMTVVIIPSYDEIISRQSDLSLKFQRLGISCEEWGSAGNARTG